MAREHNLQENIGDIAVCTDFEILELKVPIIFSGTWGFPLGMDVTVVFHFLSQDE